MRSCCGRLRPASRSPTCARRCATRCASRSRASRSRRSSPAAGGRRSWSSRRRCPSRARCNDPRQVGARSRLGRARAGRHPDRAADAARLHGPDAAAAAARARAARHRLPRLRAALPRHRRDPRRREPGARRAGAGRARCRWQSTAPSSRPTSCSPSAAAETVLHGGPVAPARLRRRRGAARGDAYSLLESGASQGWRLGDAARAAADRPAAGDRRLARAQPAALWPAPSAATRTSRSGRADRASPFAPRLRAAARLRSATGVLQSSRRELSAAAAYAGPPSVAHAEALLRAVEARSATLDGPLDAIVIGIPRTTPHLPRERPNPLLAAYLGLGLALRLWRDAFPVVEGGTVILLHRFHRHFAHPTQQPYRTIFQAARSGPREPEELARRRARGRGRRARARGVSRRPLVPSAAAVRRLVGMRARARADRLGDRRRLPRRGRRAAARLRPGARARRGAGDGAGPRTAERRASATCSRRLTFRCA